jgi:hypothetical protein
LADTDLYRDPAESDAPSLILGPAVIVGGTVDKPEYAADLVYKTADVVAWTKRMSAPRNRRDLAELRRAAAAAEKEELQRREAERQHQVKVTMAAQEEATRRGNVFARITELEKKVADQERVARAEAECRLRELERRLGEPPPPT